MKLLDQRKLNKLRDAHTAHVSRYGTLPSGRPYHERCILEIDIYDLEVKLGLHPIRKVDIDKLRNFISQLGQLE